MANAYTNSYRNRYFLTPSPPHLVHVVIEWPPTPLYNFMYCEIIISLAWSKILKSISSFKTYAKTQVKKVLACFELKSSVGKNL